MSNSSNNPHEKLAKAVLIQHLLQNGSIADDVVIINELSLEFFSRRADIALVNGSIELFEIKSEADTLSRLQGQVETFSRFCDKLHVVAAPCHIENILHNTPEDVAVWQLDTLTGITIIRRGKKNILRNKDSLLKLINAQELKQLLKKNEVKTESTRRKHLDEAAQCIPVEKLRDGVLHILKERYAQTTAQFMDIVSKNQIVEPIHIAALTRTAPLSPRIPFTNKFHDSDHDDVYMHQLASQENEDMFGSLPEEIKQLICIS